MDTKGTQLEMDIPIPDYTFWDEFKFVVFNPIFITLVLVAFILGLILSSISIHNFLLESSYLLDFCDSI